MADTLPQMEFGSGPGGTWMAPGPVYTLRCGTLAMDIAPSAGGRIASLASVDSAGVRTDWLAPIPREYLQKGFSDQLWPKAGCYPLLPFSNRIRNGRFMWEGREICLAPHAGQAHAMHGVGHTRAWHVEKLAAASATLNFRYTPVVGGWPWPFFAEQILTLTPDGLEAEIVLRNEGNGAMPAGGGFHPYFSRMPGARIQFSASDIWPVDAGEVAIRRTPVTSAEDFSSGRALPVEGLSVYYSGWHRQTTVQYENGCCLTLLADDPLDHFILHAPGGSRYFCLEPVSHVADAVNLSAQGWQGTGLHVLSPRAEYRFRVQLLTNLDSHRE